MVTVRIVRIMVRVQVSVNRVEVRMGKENIASHVLLSVLDGK